jgi:hypothetical protein
MMGGAATPFSDDEFIRSLVQRKKNCCGISCDFVTRDE